MEQISLLIKEHKLEKRKDIVKRFVLILNRDRVFNKLAPLPEKVYAIKMAHVKTYDLIPFYNECKRADKFSRYWWGRLKVANNKA